MKIVLTKSVLLDFLKTSIQEGRTGHTADISMIPGKDDPSSEDFAPITPDEQMSVQLATSAPPVGDETYVPASIDALGDAAQVIASEVPNEDTNQSTYIKSFIKCFIRFSIRFKVKKQKLLELLHTVKKKLPSLKKSQKRYQKLSLGFTYCLSCLKILSKAQRFQALVKKQNHFIQVLLWHF